MRGLMTVWRRLLSLRRREELQAGLDEEIRFHIERQGLIRSEWKASENNRRARYYSLTRAGRRQFSDEIVQWRRMSRAVNLVLEATIE